MWAGDGRSEPGPLHPERKTRLNSEVCRRALAIQLPSSIAILEDSHRFARRHQDRKTRLLRAKIAPEVTSLQSTLLDEETGQGAPEASEDTERSGVPQRSLDASDGCERFTMDQAARQGGLDALWTRHEPNSPGSSLDCPKAWIESPVSAWGDRSEASLAKVGRPREANLLVVAMRTGCPRG